MALYILTARISPEDIRDMKKILQRYETDVTDMTNEDVITEFYRDVRDESGYDPIQISIPNVRYING